MNTTERPEFPEIQQPADTDDVVFGLMMVVLVTVFMPIYLRFVYCIAVYFKNIPAYQIMLHNGIPYIVQIGVQWFFGVFTIAAFQPPRYFNKVCGGLWNASFNAAVFNLLILTLHRFVVICGIQQLQTLFTGKTRLFTILVPYIWGLLMFIVYMLPVVTVEYSLLSHSFKFTGHKLAVDFDLYFSETVLAISFVTYVIIGVFIRKSRKAKLVDRHEVRILINVFSLHMSFAVLIAAYHLQPLFWKSDLAAGVLNLFIIVKCGSDPLFIMATNRSVRKRFLGQSDVVVTISRTTNTCNGNPSRNVPVHGR